MDTKNWLLKEVLTKWNKEMEEMEKGNKQLIAILERYDEKLEKMKEQHQIQILKIEKYEEMIKGKSEPIDTETLDGWVSFLVSILEEYKR